MSQIPFTVPPKGHHFLVVESRGGDLTRLIGSRPVGSTEPGIDCTLSDALHHWVSNHDNLAKKSALLSTRTDVPLERLDKFKWVNRDERLLQKALLLNTALLGKILEQHPFATQSHLDYLCHIVELEKRLKNSQARFSQPVIFMELVEGSNHYAYHKVDFLLRACFEPDHHMFIESSTLTQMEFRKKLLYQIGVSTDLVLHTEFHPELGHLHPTNNFKFHRSFEDFLKESEGFNPNRPIWIAGGSRLWNRVKEDVDIYIEQTGSREVYPLLPLLAPCALSSPASNPMQKVTPPTDRPNLHHCLYKKSY